MFFCCLRLEVELRYTCLGQNWPVRPVTKAAVALQSQMLPFPIFFVKAFILSSFSVCQAFVNEDPQSCRAYFGVIQNVCRLSHLAFSTLSKMPFMLDGWRQEKLVPWCYDDHSTYTSFPFG